MHGLPHAVVAAEGERHVGDAATHAHAGQARLDEARRLDEVAAVVRVLLDAGRHREDVRIEDDVVRAESRLLRQQPVAALADRHAALHGVGLALLVEGHHHDGGAVPANLAGLPQERLLAFLQADRVDDGLALDALQSRLDDFPARGIHHDRHAGDVGLAGHELQEPVHGGHGIEHALVHVDVDDLGAVLHLLERHRQRPGVVVRGDELAELRGAGDVGALADVDEQRARPDVERLETRQAQLRFQLRHRARLRRASTASRIARMCSGVVPQQPPTMFR